MLEGRLDIMAANGVHWGTRSVLIAALSHFQLMEAELEMLGSDHHAALAEDQVDSLWILAHPATDLLASHVLPSLARDPPNGAGE
jgi:hypothetical protein